MSAARLLPVSLLLAACAGEPPPPPVAPAPPPLACEAKRADCNGDRADGCETDLDATAAHCGACGHACAPGEACAGGACQPAKPRAVQVDVGRDYACAVLADGTVRCWGGDTWGQIGDGASTDSRARPAQVEGVEGAVQVATSGEAACALRRDGTVACWGWSHTILGSSSSSPQKATPIDGLRDITALAAGDVHVCALARSGKVFCWGSDFRGVLGRPHEAPAEGVAPVTGVEDAVAIGSGFGGTCAIRRSGSVVCWGSIVGSKTPWQPEAVPSLADAVAVSVGTWHACALRKAGGVVCWGSPGSGRLGPGASSSDAREPIAVPGLEDAKQVSASREHSCAVLASGKVLCWGDNDRGALGTGQSLFHSAAPLPVAGLDDAVQVAARGESLGGLTCAVRKTGSVACWGDNRRGGLGVGAAARTKLPVEVEVSGATAVLTGDRFGCAAQQGGAVSCWGWGAIRAVPAFSPRARALPPVSAPLGEATALYPYDAQACALLRDGAACVFGGVPFDAGAPLEVQRPKPLAALKNAASLTSGLAVLASGELDWLPPSTYWDAKKKKLVSADQRPKPLAGVRDAVHVAGTASAACVVRRSGKVACWRADTSDLVAGKITLVEVKGLTDATRVAVSYWGGCALRRNGEVSCWSVDALRARPSKPAPRRPPPALVAEPVPSVAAAVDMSMGGEAVCAALGSGKVSCWLAPAASMTFAKLPFIGREVPGIDDALRVSVSPEHACVLRRGGKVSCWGDNRFDQTGSRADLPFANAPVDVKLEESDKP